METYHIEPTKMIRCTGQDDVLPHRVLRIPVFVLLSPSPINQGLTGKRAFMLFCSPSGSHLCELQFFARKKRNPVSKLIHKSFRINGFKGLTPACESNYEYNSYIHSTYSYTLFACFRHFENVCFRHFENVVIVILRKE